MELRIPNKAKSVVERVWNFRCDSMTLSNVKRSLPGDNQKSVLREALQQRPHYPRRIRTFPKTLFSLFFEYLK